MTQGMTSNSPRAIFNDWEDNGLPAGSHVIGKITSGSPSMFWGRVGPKTAIVNGTVLLSTSVYAAADRAGSGRAAYGMIRFANAARVARGGGTVRGATFVDLGAQSPGFNLILFSAIAGTEHGKDNAAYNIADADAWKVAGTLTTGTTGTQVNPTPNWIAAGITSLQHVRGSIPFTCATGRDLYGEIVMLTTCTPTAVGDLKIRLLVEQN